MASLFATFLFYQVYQDSAAQAEGDYTRQAKKCDSLVPRGNEFQRACHYNVVLSSPTILIVLRAKSATSLVHNIPHCTIGIRLLYSDNDKMRQIRFTDVQVYNLSFVYRTIKIVSTCCMVCAIGLDIRFYNHKIKYLFTANKKIMTIDKPVIRVLMIRMIERRHTIENLRLG